MRLIVRLSKKLWILKDMNKLSKTGLILVLIYGLCAATLIWMSVGTESKGSFVLKQLAVMPAILFIGIFDTKKLFDVAPFVGTFSFSFGLSVIIVYFIGHVLGVAGKMLFGSSQSPEK